MNRVNLLDNRITLINGDSADVLKKVKPECVDLVLTSPPYDDIRSYNGFSFDFDAIAPELWRVLKPGGVCAWIVSDATKDGSETGTSFKQALRFIDVGFKLHDTMIYRKANPLPANIKTRYDQAFEYMFILTKGKLKTANLIRVPCKHAGRNNDTGNFRTKAGITKQPTSNVGIIGESQPRDNVWTYAAGMRVSTTDNYAFAHPAMFPELLAQDHILSWSNENDVILDPFMGACTTGKMSILLNRRFIGIELSAQYFNDICIKRCEDAINARQ